MDTEIKDILAEKAYLKNRPFTVPEGYFASFKDEAKIRMEAERRPAWNKFMPYVSIAAVFVFLVVTGTFFLQKVTPVEEFTQEDFLVFSQNTINAEYYESMDHIADAELAEEDIIEYLIYSGLTAEEIQLSNYH